ncbi:MAG: hypothetical protein E7013_03495 [Alphaproteobacteria bacterium]|nr:hypothetical protein [Alphaproteobacteria bacterium]
MLQIEQDFLHAIQRKDNRFVSLCLDKGLTANIRDENGSTALEHALWYKNDEALALLATHPKTTQKTLGLTLDLLEALRFSDKNLIAAKEYEEKTSFLNKIIDALFLSNGTRIYLNAAKTAGRYCFIQKLLYQEYQNQHH